MAFRGSAPPPARRGGPGVPPRAGSPPGRGPSPGRFGGGAPPPVARRGATPPGRGPSPPPPGRGAFPPAVRGSPPSRGPPATRGAPPPRGGSPPTRGPPATRGAPPAVAPRGGPPAVAPRGGAPAAGARSGGAPLPSGAPEEFAQITAKRINVEGEDDDDDYNMDEFSTRKEDKTMISAKMLKDQEKNAEKFGQAAFNHAKKMLRVEPDKEEELRDDSEWD